MTPHSGKSGDVTVLVVGPPPTMLGGMASVVDQMLSPDPPGRYRLQLRPTTFSPDGDEPLYRRVVRHVRAARDLAATARKTGAAIVHIHTCSGFSFHRSIADLVVVQDAGCRAILHIHGATFEEFHGRAGFLQKRVINWSLARADAVIALSETWRAKLSEMSPAARLVVIENAAPAPAPAMVPEPQRDGRCRFLVLSRMDEWKGIDDLLRAAAELRGRGIEFELVLAGPDGTAGDAVVLAQKIRTCGLEGAAKYVGPVEGEGKAKLMRSADAYVQPSHNEGMPIALLEALSYSLPVIATRVGAVPEVIGDGRQGLLVPPRRPDLLASAMHRLACDPVQRRVMGKAAAVLATTRFSVDRFHSDLVSLYDALLAGRVHALPDEGRMRPTSRTAGEQADLAPVGPSAIALH